MARPDHDRDQQYHAAARQDLRQRRNRANPVPSGGRGVREELRRQEGEVSGPEGADVAVRRRPATSAGVAMVRVILPYHLRTLAHVGAEVELDVLAPVTTRSI